MDQVFSKYISFGLSVIPTLKDKRTVVDWKRFQTTLATQKDYAGWDLPIAIIAGAVSGGLVCVDFDDKGSCFAKWVEKVQETLPGVYERLVIQQTPSGGYHAVFKTSVEHRNKKLARRIGTDGEFDKDGKTPLRIVVLIETRGEGGYFLASPSDGYTLLQGSFSRIPYLTDEESDLLMVCAMEFDQLPEEPISATIITRTQSGAVGVSPLDDYDERVDAVGLLTSRGWKVVKRVGEKVMLCRPGKDSGISATWNHIPGRLYVFSSSTEFKQGTIYKPSAIYATIEHNGDYIAAAKKLYSEGFGERKKKEAITPVDVDTAISTTTVTFSSFKDRIYKFYTQPRFLGCSVDIPGLDKLIRFDKGYLNIITGIPSHGKSEFLDFVSIMMVAKHDWNFVVYSPENYPLELHFNKLAEKWHGCSMWGKDTNYITSAIQDLNDHFDFIDATEDELTMETILSTTEEVKSRKRVDALIIDPWNEIEIQRPKDMNETEFTGRCLRRLRKFARKHGICIFLVAHPAKMYRQRDSTEYPIPTLYDISGCHSEDTEVMTRDGWVTHDRLSKDSEVACFDPETKEMVYARPSRIIRKHFSGDMYRFSGKSFDQCVTPEHRMLLKPNWKDPVGSQIKSGRGRPTIWHKGEWSFCEASKVPSAQFMLPLAAHLRDGGRFDFVSPEMSELAGWYVSEGCPMSSGISLSQAVDSPGSIAIESLLNSMGIPFHATISAPGGNGGKKFTNSYYIGVRKSRPIVEWILKNCGLRSELQKIPESIRSGSDANKRSFLKSYLAGDGHLRSNGTYSATTTSPLLRDQLQSIALELGYSCCWQERKSAKEGHNRSWMLSFGREGRNETSIGSRSVRRIGYDGDVWCLTVPTGAYFTRRNGKASVSGNSAMFYNKADNGIVVYRTFTENRVTVFVKKVKFKNYGEIGAVDFSYDLESGRYTEIPPKEVSQWQD